MKKGEMSLQLIVGVVIVLIIAGVLIYLIMKYTGSMNDNLGGCDSSNHVDTVAECLEQGGVIKGIDEENGGYCCVTGGS